jgi:hypothetical protein
MSVIPVTQEVKIGGLWFEASLGKKLATTKLGIVVHTCNSSYMKGISRKITVQTQYRQKPEDTI